MRLTRIQRSSLALVTAILLLWCQSLYAMQACAALAGAAKAAAAAAPCHHDASDGSHDEHGRTAATGCEIAKAFAKELKLPVLDSGALVALPVCSRPAGACAPPFIHGDVRAVSHSPPLTLLHCRLLN